MCILWSVLIGAFLVVYLEDSVASCGVKEMEDQAFPHREFHQEVIATAHQAHLLNLKVDFALL